MSQNPTNGDVARAGPGRDLMGEIPDSLPLPALSQLARDILDDVFYNIVFDLVSQVHREEKVARAGTTAVLAQDLADKEAAGSVEAATDAGPDGTGGDTTGGPVTKGSKYEDGQVHLQGNPLDTVDEIVCPDCHLPRLLYPLFGEGARPAPDQNKEYCRKRVPIRLAGRDVHGRPYAIEKATKKKKAIASPESPSSPTTPNATATTLMQLPGKTYVPSVKCPNCPRYFFLTRIAQHLDRCVGISSRSSRNRTPMDSGLNSPAPQAGNAATRKRTLGQDGEEETGSNLAKRKKGPIGPSKLRNATDDNSEEKE